MLINDRDNVNIDLQNGHKYAVRNIRCGENVIKYGQAIGHATMDIREGEHVHTHNLATNLSDNLSYVYRDGERVQIRMESDATFLGYEREGGEVGIRNDIWIIPTVGCVNKIGERLAALTGAKCLSHPYGCSQLGDDHERTATTLCALARHPNAGGVLILGLGCENNTLDSMRARLAPYDARRVRFLCAQECEDEIAEGVRILRELRAVADETKPTPQPISRLRVGLKCGGSDGYSGITANPLVGRVTDRLCAYGASCVLTEVPEMFGAEHLLFERCESREVFERAVEMVNGFKDYYRRHGQVIYENPSPGNKAGGITTLEEKSLGCVQKGGRSIVTDVLFSGERVRRAGLSLLDGPGNDMVAVTELAATGVHLILFTTGRGTPLGSVVPTVKIATNRALAARKGSWIDFDGSVLSDEATDALLLKILAVASGEETASERCGDEQIAIFKDGVTL